MNSIKGLVLQKSHDKRRISYVVCLQRRYLDFDDGEYDVIFFESIRWGWKDKEVEASKVFLKGGEVYITKASPGKDESFFDSIKRKAIAGYLGYHYRFADFSADEEFLNEL